jgi:hypothetical protein
MGYILFITKFIGSSPNFNDASQKSFRKSPIVLGMVILRFYFER